MNRKSKPNKDSIIAVLRKPEGKGDERHWKCFQFNTTIQRDVEYFMCCIHVSNHNYFLIHNYELTEEPGRFVPFYTGRITGKLWCLISMVKVISHKNKVAYIMADNNSP